MLTKMDQHVGIAQCLSGHISYCKGLKRLPRLRADLKSRSGRRSLKPPQRQARKARRDVIEVIVMQFMVQFYLNRPALNLQ